MNTFFLQRAAFLNSLKSSYSGVALLAALTVPASKAADSGTRLEGLQPPLVVAKVSNTNSATSPLKINHPHPTTADYATKSPMVVTKAWRSYFAEFSEKLNTALKQFETLNMKDDQERAKSVIQDCHRLVSDFFGAVPLLSNSELHDMTLQRMLIPVVTEVDMSFTFYAPVWRARFVDEATKNVSVLQTYIKFLDSLLEEKLKVNK